MTELLAVLGGYVLGSMPFGYWVPLLIRHEDIRTKGSGNVGASNVFRVYGKSLGVPVALLDIAKGFAAAALGLWVGGALIGVLAAGAAMIGHARPVFLRFERGGKMAATAGGATFALAPLVFVCCVLAWLLVFAVTRYASVATIVTACLLAVPVAGHRLRSGRGGSSHRDAPPERPAALRGHRAPLRAAAPSPRVAPLDD